MNFLNDFIPEKTQLSDFPIGESPAVIKSIKEVDDHTADLSGTQKAGYPYKDIHMQVAVTFARADGKPGLHFERFNTLGFIRHSELSVKMQKTHSACPIKGYALNKKGERLISPERTEQCKSVLSQFLNVLTDKTGGPWIDKHAGKKFEIETLTGAKVNLVIVQSEYDGKTRPRVQRYRRYSEAPVLSAVKTDEEGNEQMPF